MHAACSARIGKPLSGEHIMTTFLEIAVAWAVPCLIATAIVGPMVWRKLRARRTLEAIHHARENREV
uniref:Putative transmembrane protein n=1 Tax=Ralstonia solanacearum TaxID=305 RepID=A0A0S4TN01_RALSL|nr:putative transmembrane protein [Ralstonia solanacearum]